jgi:UDP-N-acetylmuramate dehydrogenase
MTLSISENISLRDMTTFKVGGPARYFCEITTEDELCEAIDFAKKVKNPTGGPGVPFFILGGGSNILIADEGFPGLVIKMAIGTIFFEKTECGVEVSVGAGQNWDAFVAKCVTAELYGLENLSGIPGTVGAAPVQNIGAYGVEVKDVIQSVRVFDTQKNAFADLSATDCHFEYRDSIFKKQAGRYIVTSVVFFLKKEGSANLAYKDLQDFFAKSGKIATGDGVPSLSEIRNAVLTIRGRKLPDVSAPDAVGTAGSFFKNPVISANRYAELKKSWPDMPSYPAVTADSVKIPLAWILDNVCGYKGATKGNVGIYKNQALVIVNNGNATAAEIKNFANEITAAVKEKTGIMIEPEVQYIS